MSRKPRNNPTKFDRLSSEVREALIAGLLDGWTYKEASQWLKKQTGEPFSTSSLHQFWDRHCADRFINGERCLCRIEIEIIDAKRLQISVLQPGSKAVTINPGASKKQTS